MLTRPEIRASDARRQREDVIRRDMKREDGSFRDSVVSIRIDEWPAVKAGLEARIRV